ncbi:hypothetical protein RG836_24300 [Pseudomonas sp. SZMC_28357]|uniref:hypothetical protein n=1 Tax=Pseudomonas sp. SZMC_28357 TaxID=3074380 RepID=UPI002872805A|nr:hypothetical protein [Pseudomonas sp. SZMC_28357]MDR9754568.1 hypothetical protein [Pseudomonas sp. SZMC_28357]
MKLEIARGLFLVGALAVASLAVAAWEQPRSQVIGADHNDCPLPRLSKSPMASEVTSPDHDLLLFMFGLSQGMKPQS